MFKAFALATAVQFSSAVQVQQDDQTTLITDAQNIVINTNDIFNLFDEDADGQLKGK